MKNLIQQLVIVFLSKIADLLNIIAIMLRKKSVNISENLTSKNKTELKTVFIETTANKNVIVFNLDHTLKGKLFFQVLWNNLKKWDLWNQADKKIVTVEMLTTLDMDKKRDAFSLHRCAYIKKDTSFEEYYNQVSKSSRVFWEKYNVEGYYYVLVTVRIEREVSSLENLKNRISSNLNSVRSYSTFVNRKMNEGITKFIKPITKSTMCRDVICSLDIETIELNDVQIPIYITFSYRKKNKIYTISNITDIKLLMENQKKSNWIVVK
jgi:hypothetical protein